MKLRREFEIATVVVFHLAFAGIGVGIGQYDPSGRIYPWPISNDRKPLFIALIVSFDEVFNSSGVVPGVNVALDLINQHDNNLLNDYSLHYILSDSQCDETTALQVLLQQVLSETEYPKVAVVGAGCSQATDITAQVSHQFNLLQLSCASSSPELSDRRRFPNYFQLLPSMVNVAHGYVSVFQQYAWRKVVLIVQEERQFLEITSRLKELFNEANISQSVYTFSPYIGLSDLQTAPFVNEDDRIYVIATNESFARQLLCQAFHQNAKYPTHLLLTFHWYSEKWWLKENREWELTLTCSSEDRERVLLHSLAFDFIQQSPNQNTDIVTDAGITGREYNSEEQQHLHIPPHYFNQSLYVEYCFDAILTLAVALNQTLMDINSLEDNQMFSSLPNTEYGLKNFTYPNDLLTNTTFRHLQNTSLNGITGKVSFDENGIRMVNRLSVYQFRNFDNGSGFVEIGVLINTQPDSDEYTFEDKLNAIWPAGIPYDGVPNNQTDVLHWGVVVPIYLMATAGTVFAVACLAFNFIFRNRKLIRLSSHRLNNVIGVGAIFLYFGTLTLSIPTTNEPALVAVCILQKWFLSLGMSLAIGTIIMKMFRIYYILSNFSPQRMKVCKDWGLGVGVFIFATFDILVLIGYTIVVAAIDRSEVSLISHNERPQTIEGANNIKTAHFVYICDSTAEDISVALLFFYKVVLQIVAALLAFRLRTRKVKVKGLDDAKYIIAAVYISSLAIILAIVSVFAFVQYLNAFAMAFSVEINIASTAILALVFIPKMIGLYKDPEGKKVFDMSVEMTIAAADRGIGASADSDTVPSLKRRITELENIVSTYKGKPPTSGSESEELNLNI